jgi:hypothetical protein
MASIPAITMSSNTQPSTTYTSTTDARMTESSTLVSDSDTPTSQCNNIAIPDYTTLRQKSLNQINTYYQTLLGSYTKNYQDFSTNSASSNINDRKYATTTLKPKLNNYNTQLINLSKNMINNVNQDMDLIGAQKDELLTKTRQIDTIMNNITLLKDKDNEMTVLTGSRKDSLESAKDGGNEVNFTTYIYIGINVLFILIVLGLVIYIVYSSYSANQNKSSNNMYRGIAINNYRQSKM